MTDHQKLIEELEAASDGCDMYARAAQAIRSLESEAASWKADAAEAHLENVRLREVFRLSQSQPCDARAPISRAVIDAPPSAAGGE